MKPKLVLLLLTCILIAGTSAAIALVLGSGILMALLLYTLVGSTTLVLFSAVMLWSEFF